MLILTHEEMSEMKFIYTNNSHFKVVEFGDIFLC